MQHLLPMILVLAAGVIWRYIEPANLSTQQVRATMGALVINLMAPALILEVMLTSTLDKELYQIPFTGATTVAVVLAVSFALYATLLRSHTITRRQAGALIMASAFGNGMGLGLPAVSALLGKDWAGIPLIYDLLITVPFVWIGGVLLCAHFGTRIAGGGLGRELLRMPPVWALVLALLLLPFDVTLPAALLEGLHMVGTAAIPMLLLMVGMSLHIGSTKYLLLIVPVLLIKLVLSPILAYGAGSFIGLEGYALLATIMTAAAPAVVVGIALCDRFELDTELFCTAMTLSTVAYVLLTPHFTTFFGA